MIIYKITMKIMNYEIGVIKSKLYIIDYGIGYYINAELLSYINFKKIILYFIAFLTEFYE